MCVRCASLPRFLTLHAVFYAVAAVVLWRGAVAARAACWLQEMPFTDGVPPPQDVIDRFLGLCKDRFAKGNPENHTIAVHCVAGLGRWASVSGAGRSGPRSRLLLTLCLRCGPRRAPVLVAIAIMDAGLDALAAVEMIRAKR